MAWLDTFYIPLIALLNTLQRDLSTTSFQYNCIVAVGAIKQGYQLITNIV